MVTGNMNQISRMTELLARKKALLAEMLELTVEQTGAIDSKSLERLQELVEEKQKRIDEIDRLDEEFTACMDRLKAAAGVKDLSELDASRFPGARELKQATGEVLALVGKISSIEKDNSAKCRELLEEIGSQIRRLNQAKKLNNAYNRPDAGGAPSFFLDKKK